MERKNTYKQPCGLKDFTGTLRKQFLFQQSENRETKLLVVQELFALDQIVRKGKRLRDKTDEVDDVFPISCRRLDQEEPIVERRKTRHCVSWLTTYDPMVHPPVDFFDCWKLKLRPDGKRAIFLYSGQDCVIYDRQGREQWNCVPEEFKGIIPSGTVLDGIWSSPIYFIMDVIAWNHRDYVDCDFVFRQFLLDSNFTETPVCHRGVKFVTVPTTKVDLESLNRAFRVCKRSLIDEITISGDELTISGGEADIGPVMDGILFFHCEGHYAAGEVNLLALHWRNKFISKWAKPLNQFTLEYKSKTLRTAGTK